MCHELVMSTSTLTSQYVKNPPQSHNTGISPETTEPGRAFADAQTVHIVKGDSRAS